ncbi:MAG TPA: glycosyltransferase family 2 protein [bacterium]|nr:glycosyltransferase family 2 protein [bacterium]HOM27024.1 glycosyltransferase family 2 protein [bacterium]
MWRNKKVSVIFPTYNEKDSIKQAIEDFFASGFVDEIIVVNNNAVEGTDEEVRKTKARLIYEKKQGYGFAIQKGLEEATGDLLIISEPDGTFEGKDVIKLLAYSDDFDYVLGTRTTKELIWEGANMNFFLKWGNWAVAKFMEFLYNTTTLTDMGCTMRLIKRHLYEKIKNYFTVGREHFGPEMTLLVIKTGTKFIEIPVNYKPRVGKSSVTGSMRKAFFLGMKMIGLILQYKFKRIKFKQ